MISPLSSACSGLRFLTRHFLGGAVSSLGALATVTITTVGTTYFAISRLGPSLPHLQDFSPSSAGSQLRRGFSDFLSALFQGIDLGSTKSNLKSAVRESLKEAGDTFKKIKEAGDIFAKIIEGVESTANRFGKKVGGGVKDFSVPITDAMGEIVNSLFKNVTVNSVPYIAAALATIVAVPLTAQYLYKKAEKNLGKPELAIETRLVGKLDRIKRAVSDATLGSIKVIGNVFTVVGVTSVLALVTYFPLGITLDYRQYSMSRYEELYPQIAKTAILASGIIWGVGDVSKRIYSTFKEKLFAKPSPKPIFSKELQKQIEDIEKGLQNVVKHGGCFQNILFYGPGGTGKSLAAEKIARDSGMNFIRISGSDFSKFIARKEHITELNNLFQALNNSYTPTILFIDEVDSFAAKRDEMSGEDKAELIAILNTFLTHTGTSSKKFMIIAATNRPNLDEAFLSRMDEKYAIHLPAYPERVKMLHQNIDLNFSRAEKAKFFPDRLIHQMADQTDSLSGRSLEKMVNAMLLKKHVKEDNSLDEKTILKIVDRFVKQEEILSSRTSTSPELAKKVGEKLRNLSTSEVYRILASRFLVEEAKKDPSVLDFLTAATPVV